MLDYYKELVSKLREQINEPPEHTRFGIAVEVEDLKLKQKKEEAINEELRAKT